MLWLSLALLLACSAIVSSTETALFGLSRRELYEFQRAKRPLHRRVFAIMQRPHRVLMIVLIANTSVNVAIYTVSFFALRRIQDVSSLAAAAGAATVPLAVIVFGEMLPKALALSGPRRFAPSAGGVIAALQLVLGPLQWALARFVVDPITRLLAPGAPPADAISSTELRLLVEQSARDGIINSTENDMLQAIVALTDVGVRHVMTPRVDIRSVRLDWERSAVVDAFRESGRRRLPVCGHGLDDIRGVLYARDLYLNPNATVAQLMRRAHFVPEQVDLMRLLRHFRTERIQMAILVDEHGGTSGLVTGEDVAEWIVGDLPDTDTPRPTPPTEQIDPYTYRLSGDLSARVWANRFAAGKIDKEIDTVAGLILARLGRLPHVGDAVQIRNLTLTVESMVGRRIERVLLRHGPAPTPPPESTA